MAWEYDEVLEYAAARVTPCQKRPEVCEARRVTHVAWDADGVLWDIHPYAIASSIRPPFKLIDEDTLEAGEEPYYRGYEPPKKPKKKPPEAETAPLFPSEEEKEVKEIAEELLQSVPEEKRPQLPPVEREVRWDPEWQAWYEKKVTETGISWILMPKAQAPAPPPLHERNKHQRKIIKGQREEPPLLPPPPPAPPKREYYGRKVTVKLLPTLRETLGKLKERKISSSVISLNSPGSVKAILEAFGLQDNFLEIRDSWESKAKVFGEITRKFKIAPCNSLFVDDTLHQVESVGEKCALALHMGRDIRKPIEIMRYIEVKK